MRQLFLIVVAPVVAVATIAFFGITLSRRSSSPMNQITRPAAGFWANQVSSVLGLGALLCFFLVLHKGVNNKAKVAIGGAMAFLGAQSAMTFSRAASTTPWSNHYQPLFTCSVMLGRASSSRFWWCS
ncbi:MAG: hypothetical protein WKF84_20640 [Pyrinomonadaceae bacterium]